MEATAGAEVSTTGDSGDMGDNGELGSCEVAGFEEQGSLLLPIIVSASA